MNNVLDLDELVVLHKWVDEENKVKMYEVEAKEDPVLCSKCGCMLDVDVEELSKIIDGINV